jgi:hypothetical protein
MHACRHVNVFIYIHVYKYACMHAHTCGSNACMYGRVACDIRTYEAQRIGVDFITQNTIGQVCVYVCAYTCVYVCVCVIVCIKMLFSISLHKTVGQVCAFVHM